MLNSQLVDFLVINETHFNVDDDSSDFAHPSYKLIRRDRRENPNKKNQGGGGIAVYVKKNIILVESFKDPTIELIRFIMIDSNKKRIGILACYRPPHPDNEEEFFENLDFRFRF